MSATQPSVPPPSNAGEAYLWALGIATGVCVVVAAWVVEMKVSGVPISPASAGPVHISNPLLFLVDLLPIALGWMLVNRARTEQLSSSHGRIRRRLSEANVLAPLVTTVLDAVLLANSDGRIEEANPGAERLFGSSVDVIRGRTVASLLPDYQEVGAAHREFRKTGRGEVLGVEWRMTAIHSDGTSLPVRVSYSTFTVDADQKTVYVVRDISVAVATDQKLRSQVEAAMSERDAIAGRIEVLSRIHLQMRTPLQALVGQASLAGDRTLVRHARGVLGTVDHLVDLVRLESEDFNVLLEPVPVARLMSELEGAYKPSMTARGGRFDLQVDPDAGSARADPGRLRQMMHFIVGSAVEAAGDGGVTVAAMPVVHEGLNCVAFVVADTGPGMPQQLLDAAMDVDPEALRDLGAKGLGLAVARRLAVVMGGELTAHSELGRGARVALRLPGITTQRPTERELDTSDTIPPEAFADPDTDESAMLFSRGLVMVIGDEPLREQVTRVLNTGGKGVRGAPFNKALGRLKKEAPSAIVLPAADDAWPIMKEVKGDPKRSETRFVVLCDGEEQAEAAYAAGAAELLEQPVQDHDLRAALARCHLPPANPRVIVAGGTAEVRKDVVADLRGVGWCTVGTPSGLRSLDLLEASLPAAMVVFASELDTQATILVSAIRANPEWAGVGVVVIGADDEISDATVVALPQDAPTMHGEVRRAVTDVIALRQG